MFSDKYSLTGSSEQEIEWSSCDFSSSRFSYYNKLSLSSGCSWQLPIPSVSAYYRPRHSFDNDALNALSRSHTLSASLPKANILLNRSCPDTNITPIWDHENVAIRIPFPLSPSYVCPRCSKTFGRKTSLQRHLKGHSEDKDFACFKCDKAFKRKDILIRHYKSARCKNTRRIPWQTSSLNSFPEHAPDTMASGWD